MMLAVRTTTKAATASAAPKAVAESRFFAWVQLKIQYHGREAIQVRM